MSKPKALLIFEGGNAPGYSAVAASLSEEGSKCGIEIYAAYEGFRSLTGDHLQDYRIVRLVPTLADAYKLNTKRIPAFSTYKAFHDGGSQFRSERYPLFREPEKIQASVDYIKSWGFTHLVGIGGNGTLAGIQSLARHLTGVQTGFINISVDNDIYGDLAVGYLSGAETGAQICHGLFNDAYTHKRIYILEMMGRESGRHALMSGASSRAHLIILPGFNLSKKILKDIAKALNNENHALIVVAEGYAKDIRLTQFPTKNAAEYFKLQLDAHQLNEGPTRRVITESYSRFIRGKEPLFIEIGIATLKAHTLFNAFQTGLTDIMPYYLGERDLGIRKFEDIRTSNEIDQNFVDLIDRFRIPSLRKYVLKEFKNSCDMRLVCPVTFQR